MPSHYLNQCWNIVNCILRRKLPWNLNRNSYILIHEIAFENVVWKTVAILFWPQCVDDEALRAGFTGNILNDIHCWDRYTFGLVFSVFLSVTYWVKVQFWQYLLPAKIVLVITRNVTFRGKIRKHKHLHHSYVLFILIMHEHKWVISNKKRDIDYFLFVGPGFELTQTGWPLSKANMNILNWGRCIYHYFNQNIMSI